VDHVKLVPRTYQGTPLCVPEFVNVYVLDNGTGQWRFVQTVSLPADISPSGYVIPIPNQNTPAVLLDTDRLRFDGAGGYYFQMAEVSAGTR
jgi:hypothetical protein